MTEKQVNLEKQTQSPANQIEDQAKNEIPKILQGFLEILNKKNLEVGHYLDASETISIEGMQIVISYQGRVSEQPASAQLHVVVYDGTKEDGIVDCAFWVHGSFRDMEQSLLPNRKIGSISSIETSFFRRKNARFISDPKDKDGVGLEYPAHRSRIFGEYQYPTAYIQHSYRPSLEWAGGRVDPMQVTEVQPNNGFMSFSKDEHEATPLGVSSFRHLMTGLSSVLDALREHQKVK